MKKYIVTAIRYDSDLKAQIEFVAGEFREYHMAYIFKNAYNKLYSADARILEVLEPEDPEARR